MLIYLSEAAQCLDPDFVLSSYSFVAVSFHLLCEKVIEAVSGVLRRVVSGIVIGEGVVCCD